MKARVRREEGARSRSPTEDAEIPTVRRFETTSEERLQLAAKGDEVARFYRHNWRRWSGGNRRGRGTKAALPQPSRRAVVP